MAIATPISTSKTSVTYKTNAEGKNVKVTTTTTTTRREFVKFGDCRGFPAGPDSESTTIGDDGNLQWLLNFLLFQPYQPISPSLHAILTLFLEYCEFWTIAYHSLSEADLKFKGTRQRRGRSRKDKANWSQDCLQDLPRVSLKVLL